MSSSYFSEGYPYSLVHQLPEVLFTQLGASLQLVGLTALLHLPWNLKLLWGPLVDRYSSRRRWMVMTQLIAAALIAGIALLVGLKPPLAILGGAFALLAFVAATQDIAIDAFYLEALDPEGQAKYVGLRALAYRLAMLLVAGPALFLIDRLGWTIGLGLLAALMGGLALLHALALPPGTPARRRLPARIYLSAALLGLALVALLSTRPQALSFNPPPWLASLGVGGVVAILLLLGLVLGALFIRRLRASPRRSAYAEAFTSFLDQPRVGHMLAFIVLYRLGESFLMKMKYPFLSGLGVSLHDYSLASGTLGMIAALIAPVLGGWLIARHGLHRWIWPFTIAQNGLNLVYWGLAVHGQAPSFTLLCGAIMIEMFGAGLGTAVFMVYLMRCARPEHRAAHMAIVTALMSVSFTLAGAVSGALADAMGFAPYFALSAALGIPAMLLISGLPSLRAPASA